MKKIKLPDIVESAKKRPLSINPETGNYIYYDDIETGKEKITPLKDLNEDQLLKLSIERHLSDEPSTLVTLNGESFDSQQAAKEIQKQTKVGKQFFSSDMNYLKYYLSQFPKESFEK